VWRHESIVAILVPQSVDHELSGDVPINEDDFKRFLAGVPQAYGEDVLGHVVEGVDLGHLARRLV
jgi:hypothetical protein